MENWSWGSKHGMSWLYVCVARIQVLFTVSGDEGQRWPGGQVE